MKKIKKKDGVYLVEVEGKWVDGKSVQKYIRYVGTMYRPDPNIFSKAEQKQIRDLEIVKKVKAGKSEKDLALLYEVTSKTIKNIKKRYSKDGIRGLVHTRSCKYETVKVSTPEQAAIITDFVKNSSKDAKEIKKTIFVNSTVSEIKKIISPIVEHLKLKKKIKLEIV